MNSGKAMTVTELTRRIGFDARFLRKTMKPR